MEDEKERKTLKFIHITKNAGSSIENRGRHCYWGKYHKEYRRVGYHTPFPMLSLELREKYDWFMVVRNPYARIVSEMNCRFASNWGNRLKHHSKAKLNELLRAKILQRNSETHFTGHFIEQHLYLESEWVFGKICETLGWHGGGKKLGTKAVASGARVSVLKYENLDEEFGALMKEYGLSVRLDGERANVCDNRLFELEDIDEESRVLIHEVYAKDFELFGYDKDSAVTVGGSESGESGESGEGSESGWDGGSESGGDGGGGFLAMTKSFFF